MSGKTDAIKFGTRKLFHTILKSTKGEQRPVVGVISELTSADLRRPDLSRSLWKRTKFGENIIDDYRVKATGRYTPESLISPEEDVRFFATEIADKKGKSKAITLGEAKVRDEFICLDRLQSIKNHSRNEIKGGGSGILYAVVNLAKKLNKSLVTLEAHKKSIPFYRKLGMSEFANGNLHFFRVYKQNYDEFLQNLERKFSITQANEINFHA